MDAITQSALIQRAISKLYNEGFTGISRSADRRSSVLTVNGASVELKIACADSNGKWLINIHHHGKIDEKGVDAYLLMLVGVPGNGAMPVYLIIAAPVCRSCYRFSFSSLIRLYSAHIEDWPTLEGICKAKSGRTRGAKAAPFLWG